MTAAQPFTREEKIAAMKFAIGVVYMKRRLEPVVLRHEIVLQAILADYEAMK